MERNEVELRTGHLDNEITDEWLDLQSSDGVIAELFGHHKEGEERPIGERINENGPRLLTKLRQAMEKESPGSVAIAERYFDAQNNVEADGDEFLSAQNDWAKTTAKKSVRYIELEIAFQRVRGMMHSADLMTQSE